MKYLYCYILISLHSVLLAQSIDQPDITYPEIYEEEVKETFFGVEVVDPYRHLENQERDLEPG